MVIERTQLKTVLYIDDEPDIREVVQMALGIDESLRVRTCESGEQALFLMQEVKPDLVLLDVMMSGMDGPATLRRIREDPALADVPVIFMTAKAMPREVELLRKMGAIGVIGKPFDPMKLCKQVLALWEKTPQLGGGADIPAMQARLTRLSADYLERTLEDVARLRALLTDADVAEPLTFKQVERLAHRIRGAGAALGFASVSDCAGEIERLAEGNAREGSAPDPQIAQRLVSQIGRLREVVEKLVVGFSPQQGHAYRQ